MSHQVMGYDRAITMFSPDGRLLQVEYAKKTVKQGSTAIGMVCKDGVLLVTDKRIVDPLIVAESVEKIFKIDDHMGATAAGILSDARLLIERAQVKAQQHQVTFDSPIDTMTIVKDICDLKQMCTQSGGLRPFGVSLLIVGVDSKGPSLYETDPTGIYFQYHAAVIGEAETKIEEIFQKEYKKDITIEAGLKLAIKALSKALEDNITVERIDCAYITNEERKFTRVDRSKIAKILGEAKKK
ncbi:proteasome endopeptidase complex, archaeal, alpha subunit [Candidatus Woesearchaeota archaeon CG10_big_fil_rev_8_21_14_0_10_44_13]|nr:MAG: proteasome endopeptidase complex, archaeal, alpha subunit [Candidatus Woesearchaeota archaeon CG10_big_fil_rev_8_21_14_0_10_44_13]